MNQDGIMLNLGCGTDIREGYVNVDRIPAPKVDEVVDLDGYPWPWKNGSAKRILMDNVLEHLKDPEKAIKESVRVLKVDGIFDVIVPHYLSPAAHRPNHRSSWGTSSFNEYTPKKFGGRKGLDAKKWFHIESITVLHHRPYGLRLPKAVPICKPHNIRFVLRRLH